MRFVNLSLISVLITLLLTACTPPQTSAPAAAAHVDNKTFKHSVKPGAAVKLADAAIYYLQQGQSTDILLTLVIAEPNGVMDVQVTASDELTLYSNDHAQFTLSSQERYDLPVQLIAQQNGRYYLNLLVKTRINERMASRVLTVIVQVGDAQELQKSVPAGAYDGRENVVSMPAQETITP